MYKHLLEHTEDETEVETIEALDRCLSQSEAARSLGVTKRTVERRLSRIRARANIVPTGYSTLIRHKHREDSSTGKLLEWIKSKVDHTRQLEAFQAIVDSMISELPPIPPIPYQSNPKEQSLDEFTVIPLGDPHIGLMTWSKEVGVDWDLNIAYRVFKKVFERLLKRLPDTKNCVLVNTGDFFHADNIQGVTSRSGHRLDLDGRHGKWLDAGFCIIRMFIDYCRRKYEHVDFFNVPGNHDDILGRAIGSFAYQLYRDEPRVTVHKGDNPFQYYRHGKALLGFAHGHTCKLSSLPGKMADDQAKLWGKTTYRHWITGHVHHNSWQQFKEHPGCTVETVGIIPPKDAYAHGGAYGAGRGIQALVIDSKDGYVKTRVSEIVKPKD